MTFDKTYSRLEVPMHDETVGKVFVVINSDTRLCLLCEQLFTRQGSFEHSNVRCYPTAKGA